MLRKSSNCCSNSRIEWTPACRQPVRQWATTHQLIKIILLQLRCASSTVHCETTSSLNHGLFSLKLFTKKIMWMLEISIGICVLIALLGKVKECKIKSVQFRLSQWYRQKRLSSALSINSPLKYIVNLWNLVLKLVF